MDVVARTAKHPQPGETVFGHELHYIPGGKGANQAIAAARLTEPVYMIGKLGRDPFGDTLSAFLKGERLHLDYLGYDDDTPTGVALITVSDESENTIVVVSGSNYRLTEADVLQADIGADDVVVSVFEIPQTTIKALFARARENGATTVLNPAPAATFIEGLLALVDVLIVNETELAFFTGTAVTPDDDSALEQAARSLRVGPAQTVVVTLGARGSLCLHGEQAIRVSGMPVQAVDTTGAGDCFTGALAVALYEGMALESALGFANTAAALSVQTLGAAVSMPERAAVDEALTPGPSGTGAG